jgi:hypothetical protein
VKYVDDLVLMAKEEIVLQGMIDKLIEIGRCYGMEMNVEKTKVMRISRQPSPVKGKGKVRLWVFQHLCLEGVLYSYPNEFLHSSPEALHTKRRERPLSVKEGTISEFS